MYLTRFSACGFRSRACGEHLDQQSDHLAGHNSGGKGLLGFRPVLRECAGRRDWANVAWVAALVRLAL